MLDNFATLGEALSYVVILMTWDFVFAVQQKRLHLEP